MRDKPKGPTNERFMRHHYGASGFVDKLKAEEQHCPACGNTKIPMPLSIIITEIVSIAVRLDPQSRTRLDLEDLIRRMELAR